MWFYLTGDGPEKCFISNLGVDPHAHVRVEGKVSPVVGPLPLLAISRAPLPPAALEVGQVLVVGVAQPRSMLRPSDDERNQVLDR